jgi:hypothetical protein
MGPDTFSSEGKAAIAEMKRKMYPAPFLFEMKRKMYPAPFLARPHFSLFCEQAHCDRSFQ